MKLRLVVLSALMALGLVLGACGSSPDRAIAPETKPPTATPDGGAAAGGTQLAPGLYELEGGRAQAVGVLEYRDLEGGMWVIVGGTQAEGNEGATVAVIANPAEFSATLKELQGKRVIADGRKLDGASIRMAGPEIELGSIEALPEGGPAD